MGLFATLKGDRFTKCPKCDKHADWQLKGLWLIYKELKIWIGAHKNVELDENMNGHIIAWRFPKELMFKNDSPGCGHITYYKIINGELIESSEKEYGNL